MQVDQLESTRGELRVAFSGVADQFRGVGADVHLVLRTFVAGAALPIDVLGTVVAMVW